MAVQNAQRRMLETTPQPAPAARPSRRGRKRQAKA
jgi:hypothetical protein